MDEVIAVDVGNSAVKVALRPATKEVGPNETSATCCFQSFSLSDEDWIDRLCRYLSKNLDLSETDPSLGTLEFVVSTVNHSASDPMEKGVRQFLASKRRQMLWNPVRFDSIPMLIKVDFPERVGIDRLVSAYAAAKRYDQPTVVIDAGSAVTIDWVDRDTEGNFAFCGGAILPGIQLQLAALANGTEAIDRISMATKESVENAKTDRFSPGKFTEDAIRVGVMAGLVGSIERLVCDYSNESALSAPQVILTGGDGPSVSAHLRLAHERVPDLVCQGLFHLAEK